MPFDANEVHPNLWQGGKPPEGSALAQRGFQALVLCAREHQPAASRFPGLQVIYAPNDDDFSRMPTRDELRIAVKAARQVAGLLKEGKKVLSTCWMGRNRSGLVTALALHLLTGKDGISCLSAVKAVRAKSLRNPGFQEVLANLKARRSPSDRPPVESRVPVRGLVRR